MAPKPEPAALAARQTRKAMEAMQTDLLLSFLGGNAKAIDEAKKALDECYAERADAVRVLHSRGLSLAQIAEAAGVTRMMVRRYLEPAPSPLAT